MDPETPLDDQLQAMREIAEAAGTGEVLLAACDEAADARADPEAGVQMVMERLNPHENPEFHASVAFEMAAGILHAVTSMLKAEVKNWKAHRPEVE